MTSMVRSPAHSIAVTHVLVADEARGVDDAVLGSRVASGRDADAVEHPKGLGRDEGGGGEDGH